MWADILSAAAHVSPSLNALYDISTQAQHADYSISTAHDVSIADETRPEMRK